jgi:hypothetical protein
MPGKSGEFRELWFRDFRRRFVRVKNISLICPTASRDIAEGQIVGVCVKNNRRSSGELKNATMKLQDF